MRVREAGLGRAGRIAQVLVRWSNGDPASPIDSRLMARSLGAVFVSGATLALVWVVLPSPPQSDRAIIAGLAGVAGVVGIVLLSGALDHQRPVAFEVAVALATLLISLGEYFARVRGTGLSYLYMWCTPYAYWFFPRGRALIQVALVALGFGLASLGASLAHPELAGTASSDWGRLLLLTGTVLIVGELVRHLGVRIGESHRRFARIFTEAPAPLARLSLGGRVLDANPAFCAALGRPAAEVIGTQIEELTGREHLSALLRSRERLLAGDPDGAALELDLRRPDGSTTSLYLGVSLLGRPGTSGAEMYVQALDLTGRKEAERALAASEQRYRTLVETSQAVVWSSSPDGVCTFINDAVRPLLGYAPEEVIGRPLTKLLMPDQIPGSMERFALVAEGGTSAGERRLRRRDGREIVGSYSVAAVRDEHGALTGFAGTVLDVTEQRRAQEALRVSEARLRALIDNAPSAITIRDAEGRLTAVNLEAARLLGRAPDELLGTRYPEIGRHHERQELMLTDRRVLETGEPLLHEHTVHDGELERIFLAVAFLLPGAPGEPPQVCRISLDVTDRELARQQLERASEQRRRLLAELVRAQEDERRRIAADVHDESIQVLAGVAIRLGMLSAMLERPEQQRLIAGLDESVRRGIKSLRQLLFDLRLPALDELGLAAALRSYLSETIAREGVTYTLEDHLEREPPPELRTVLYRVAQEALSNVRKHAHARNVEVRLSGSEAGFTALVRDDGVGFDPASAPDDVPGHLGMVGMRERVYAAGGWIEVHSEPGRGTTIEFGVPATEPVLAVAGEREL